MILHWQLYLSLDQITALIHAGEEAQNYVQAGDDDLDQALDELKDAQDRAIRREADRAYALRLC